MRSATHLSVVREPPASAADPADPVPVPDTSDLVLVGTLFGLNLVPVVGELAGFGHWSAAIVGFATAAALLTGRELLSQLRARAGTRLTP